MDNRPILFVGDIQGCSHELALLLEAAGFRAATHRLIPLGDTINRGPDAPGVLALLRQVEAEPIQGNHERALLKIATGAPPPPWALQPWSAYAQLTAHGSWEAELAQIAQWPLWREGPDWLAVHAGLHPRLPPGETAPEMLTELRFCDAHGAVPAHLPGHVLEPPPGFAPWYEHHQSSQTVMFGHWARKGLVRRERVRGLDTGCVYGRALSGLWWPEDRLVQVPAARVYRPPQGGRVQPDP